MVLKNTEKLGWCSSPFTWKLQYKIKLIRVQLVEKFKAGVQANITGINDVQTFMKYSKNNNETLN